MNQRLIIIITIATFLLLIPFVAMLITQEVVWTLADFIVAGILLYGVGFFCELLFRKIKNAMLRIALCLIILLVFVLIWAELAVGIFESAFAGS